MPRLSLTGMRAFSMLVAGQFISTVGSGMTRFGLGVWVYAETGDTRAYTTLVFFAALPVGLGALVAGPLVDRWDRRRVMMLGDSVAGLSTLAVALLYFAGALDVWHLYVSLFVNGVATAFTRPALDASIPLIVPKGRLTRATGFSQLVASLESILSPSLAGFIVGVFGLGAIFVIDFLTFGVNILAVLLSAVPRPHQTIAARRAQSFWRDFVSGLGYLRGRPAMIYLLGLFTVTMFLLPGLAYSLVTPLVLNFAGEETLGLITSGFGVGTLVGGLFLTLWRGSWRRMHGILGGMTAAGLAAILVSWREDALLIGIGFVVTGISFVLIMGLSRVIWQTKTPPDMLGRVFSLQTAFGIGGQTLGIVLAGTLAEVVFEPLFASGGALVSSIGAVIGSGPGRGMAFMFLVVGLLELLIVLVSAALPAVRCLEDRLPDHDSSGAPRLAAGVAPEAAEGLPGPPTYPPLDDRR